jgi:granule-bound starch synthase
LQEVYQPRGQFKSAKVAFCIHNIAFQGRFWPESFKDMALPQSTMNKLGFIDGYSKVRGVGPWALFV